jgi:tetratricopeptide (TPR) repeat protein
MPATPTTPRRAGFALLALMIAGCAAPSQAISPAPPPAADPTPPAATSAAVEDDEANYPKQALTREWLFGMLIGDIAAQQGDKQLGAETWLEIARRTGDGRAAKRALELALSGSRYALAVAAAQRWHELEPASLAPRQTLLTLLARGNRLPEAEETLNAWLTDLPKDAPSLLLEMHTLWQPESDKQVVLAMTQRLTERFPSLPESHLALAMAYRDADKLDKAITEVDLAIERRPDWEAAILYRSSLTQQRSTPDAISFLQAASKRLPNALDIKLQLARLLNDERRYAESRVIYAALGKAKPDEVEYPIGEALSAMQLRDFDAARVALERALTLNPKRPGAIHYYLGVAAEEQLQFAQARDFYRQADDAEYAIQTATRLAHIEARLGNKDGALAELAKLPGTSPQNQIAKLQLEAQIWRELKDLPRARSLLDEGLKQHADNADLLYDRSLVADQMGDTPGAERDLRQFLALNPESPLALNALGYTLANRTDRLKEAEDLIRRALAKEPSNPVIMDSLGWLLVRRGQPGDAIKWFADAFASMPDPEIAAHYGEALWRTGQHDAARKIWAEGRKLDPRHDVLLETVHRLSGQ